ncbi:MAG: hypothetical protein ACREH8_07060 [Opitutaceae bacterium]
MDSLLVVVLVALGLVVLIGGVVAFFALRKAPDGFEDDEGFHPTNKPKR